MHARMHVINAILLATLFAASVLVWPELPDRIPAQFGADGAVTRSEASSFARWMLPPLIALGLVALNYGLAALLPRRPGLFNHPDKQTFLALPPARRAPVIARMRAFLYGISALLVILFGVLQWTRYRTAVGEDSGAYVALTVVIGVMLGPLALGLWLPPISREVREQARREAEEGQAQRG